MDAELKEKWVDALRSGKYKQTQYRLKDRCGYCCIGVGFLVATGKQPKRMDSTAPAAKALGLGDEYWPKLVDMNDFDGKNFSEIADYIEQNL
jgi:hypothetical protein